MNEEESLSEMEESEVICVDSSSEQQQNLLATQEEKVNADDFLVFVLTTMAR